MNARRELTQPRSTLELDFNCGGFVASPPKSGWCQWTLYIGIVGRIGCASHHSTCNGPTTVGSSPGVFQGTDAGLQWFVLGASRHWKMCSLWRGNNCAKLRGFTSSRLGRCTAICHAPATRLLRRKPPQTAMERLVSHVHTSIFAQVDAHGQNNGGLVSDFCFVLLQSRAFGADMGLLAQGGGSHCSPGRRVLLKKMTAHVKNKPCILQC